MYGTPDYYYYYVLPLAPSYRTQIGGKFVDTEIVFRPRRPILPPTATPPIGNPLLFQSLLAFIIRVPRRSAGRDFSAARPSFVVFTAFVPRTRPYTFTTIAVIRSPDDYNVRRGATELYLQCTQFVRRTCVRIIFIYTKALPATAHVGQVRAGIRSRRPYRIWPSMKSI